MGPTIQCVGSKGIDSIAFPIEWLVHRKKERYYVFVDDFGVGKRDSLTRLRSGNLGIKWPTHHAEIKARRN